VGLEFRARLVFKAYKELQGLELQVEHQEEQEFRARPVFKVS
jgi:hypothetical protein